MCRFSAVLLVRFFLFGVFFRYGDSVRAMGKNCYFWHGVRLSLSLKFSAVASQAGKQKERVMLYPIGIQNFESLRQGGFTYVDKTELIYQLAATGRYYFLGRPRRFGKSLLLSTMEAYFQGKKDLFKGLAIENQEKDWTEYPVLHLDWGGATYTSESIFNDKIENALRRWEQEYGIDNVLTADSVRFENIIDAAYGKTGKAVVILIDEYDKPIVDNLDREELKESFRSRLSGFYSVMKAQDGKIRLGFLTGITKIGQLNIFSGLNNLQDISMDPRYVDLCGISEEDLHRYFDEGVQELADANNLSKEACYAKLAQWYDGYHFSESSIGIYNPFSLLNTLSSKRFTEYWYATGTPTFLTVALKQTGKDISELIANEVEVDITDLSQVDSYRVNPIPLLYQTGYLTIKDANPDFGTCRLGFPNREVKNGFLRMQLALYVPEVEAIGSNVLVLRLYRAIEAGKPEEMMKLLDGLFAGQNYQIQDKAEKNVQYAMSIIFNLLGQHVHTECQTSNGRIDLFIENKDYIYIIELKIDTSADDALQQIEDKGYARPYVADPRKLFKIGVNFSTQTRRIEEWKII